MLKMQKALKNGRVYFSGFILEQIFTDINVYLDQIFIIYMV